MTTPTQLSIYNGALTILGQQELSSTSENTPRRHYLDEVWGRNFRERCLKRTYWNFATRTSKLTYDSSIDPDFGYTRVHPLPSDYLRTVELSSNGYFTTPMTGNSYRQETGYIYCDYDEIYMRYVSNDASYGLDYTKWPPDFEAWVEAALALDAEEKISQGSKKQVAVWAEERLFKQAASVDAINQGSRKPPLSSWASGRLGRHIPRRNEG